MKIGILGGSFNPVTKAHLKMAKKSIEFLKLDKLFFLPSFINPNKKKLKENNSKHRLKMLSLILEDKMEISNYEINKKGISYTWESLKYFCSKYKNDEIFFIMGSDNLAGLDSWENIFLFKDKVCFVIFKREKYKKHINLKKFNTILIDNEIDFISSTSFKNGNFSCVDKKVRKYIFDNFLYFDQILKNTQKAERYIHSRNAADFAYSISKQIGYKNPYQAYKAAYLHDVTKEWSKERHIALIKKYSDLKKVEEYQYHQESAYLLIKYVFGSEDEELNLALRFHTSLCLNMSDLDTIIYLADKLAIGRKFKGIQKLRDLAHKDIYAALSLVIQENIKFNLTKGIKFSKEQENIYNKWIKN